MLDGGQAVLVHVTVINLFCPGLIKVWECPGRLSNICLNLGLKYGDYYNRDKLIYLMLVSRIVNTFRFSTITHIRGRPENRSDDAVELRGIRIQSTQKDSPNLIFIPEAFDQAESWLRFFSNPDNKIIQQRNVYIVYPRNFGNSDRNPEMTWESHAHDIMRFMYSNRISMATLGGHGLGGKIALATACFHQDKVTGYFGFDTTPTEQYYFEPMHELRGYLQSLKEVKLNRGFSAISLELRSLIKDPKWRSIFESNIAKQDGGYNWKFNLEAIWNNIKDPSRPDSLTGWSSQVGVYAGRALFALPDNSRHVHLGTNTLPYYRVCTQLKGYLHDVFSIQGDEGVQNHWVYERQDGVNPYAFRLANFLKNYDGVHTLLVSREEVGSEYVPQIFGGRVNREPVASDVKPAHYYHNWRFNNVYAKQE